MVRIWHYRNDKAPMETRFIRDYGIVAMKASPAVHGSLNFYRKQFSISVSRYSFTFILVLARVYRTRLIRCTPEGSSLSNSSSEPYLLASKRPELINGASLNRTNEVPLSTFRPLIRHKLHVRRDISFCTFVCLSPTWEPCDSRGNKLIRLQGICLN